MRDRAAKSKAEAAAPSAFATPARSGRPLPQALAAELQPRFDIDLSAIRIHADQDSATAARQLGARAYTLGRHIGFAHGAFQPSTAAGRRLLTHELAHAAQQARGGARPADGGQPALEADAERVAAGDRSTASSGVGLACDGLEPGRTGRYARRVRFATLGELIQSSASAPIETNEDGSYTATVWSDEPPAAVAATPAPVAPAAQRAPARTRPTPAPTPPVSARQLRDAVDALPPEFVTSPGVRAFQERLAVAGSAAEVLGGALTGWNPAGAFLVLHGADQLRVSMRRRTDARAHSLFYTAGEMAAGVASDDPKWKAVGGIAGEMLGAFGSMAASLKVPNVSAAELEAAQVATAAKGGQAPRNVLREQFIAAQTAPKRIISRADMFLLVEALWQRFPLIGRLHRAHSLRGPQQSAELQAILREFEAETGVAIHRVPEGTVQAARGEGNLASMRVVLGEMHVEEQVFRDTATLLAEVRHEMSFFYSNMAGRIGTSENWLQALEALEMSIESGLDATRAILK